MVSGAVMMAEVREVLSLIFVMLTGAEEPWASMPYDERCARAANEAQQAFLRLEDGLQYEESEAKKGEDEDLHPGSLVTGPDEGPPIDFGAGS